MITNEVYYPVLPFRKMELEQEAALFLVIDQKRREVYYSNCYHKIAGNPDYYAYNLGYTWKFKAAALEKLMKDTCWDINNNGLKEYEYYQPRVTSFYGEKYNYLSDCFAWKVRWTKKKKLCGPDLYLNVNLADREIFLSCGELQFDPVGWSFYLGRLWDLRWSAIFKLLAEIRDIMVNFPYSQYDLVKGAIEDWNNDPEKLVMK